MGKTKKRFIDTDSQVSIHRACKYIGSFAINVMKSEERQTLMNERLDELKNVKKGVPVVLQVATNGIKVFDESEKAVKMAHSIMRIAFSTCSTDARLFSYVAKSSITSENPSILQAHVFKTKKGSHAQQLSQLVSKAFKIAFAIATVKRKTKVDAFESSAKIMKQTSIEVKRRWAKKEIARGHEYAEHAQQARKTHPLAMLPGPSNPIDQDMLQVEDNRRPRNVSNVVYDNQKVPRQNSETTVLSQRLVDAQINSATSNSNSVDTPPKQQNRTVSPVVEIEPDLSHEISTTDNNVADNYLIANGGGSTAEESNIVENIDANDSASVPSNGLNVVGSRVPARDEIYENVNVVISTEGEGTSSKPADGVYVDTVISSAPDSYYESLTYPDGDTPAGGAHQSDQQSRSSSAKTVGNGVEEVPEVTVTSNEDSEDDELYLALDQLKQGKCELTPADSAVLEDSYWYQPGIPRDIAEEMLQIAMPGTFFIRDSSSNPGFFALSMKVPHAVRESGIANILIEREPNGYFRMPGLKDSFPSLPMMVAYYASYQDELPVKLRLTYDEDQSVTGASFNAGSVAANNVAPTASADPAASGKSLEEDAIAMIDAALPDDPDFALYANCDPILNELNAQ